MAKISSALKKTILVDWLTAFPSLTGYSNNKLYKIVGPLIIGLELIKLPFEEAYRPHFFVYSLWGNKAGKDIQACLSVPILLLEFKNMKGRQYSIPYAEHSIFFDEVKESVRRQLPLPFDRDIPLNEIYAMIDRYSKMPPLSAAPDSYLQGSLQAAKLGIALYVGELGASLILEDITRRKWDAGHFKLWGLDIESWLQSLRAEVEHRADFLHQIAANKQDKKVRELKSSEII